MAVAVQETCIKCANTFTDYRSGGLTTRNITCPDCRRKEDQAKEDMHFATLDSLTIEERIRRIEEWIYHYKPQYVDPPKF